MVRTADLKGDGKLSWGEFCLMMNARLPVARVAWRTVPLFRLLTADEVAQIMQLGVTRQWEEGEDLIQEGDVATSLFVIEEGEVEVSVTRKADIAPPRSFLKKLRRAVSSDDFRRDTSASDQDAQDDEQAEEEMKIVHEELAALRLEAAGQPKENEREVVVLLAAKTMVGELEFTSPDKVRNTAVTATRTVIGHEIRYDDLRALLERDVSLGYKVDGLAA